MVIAASFYAPRPDHPRHVYDFLACLRLQRASCERYGVDQIVITDALQLGDLATFHTELPRDLMPAIIAGQLAFLDHGPPGDLLLIGADGVLGRDPAPLFDGSFDLAVTTHPFADCILNTGMVAVAAGAREAAAELWARALARCGTAWGDDQLALASVIRPTLDHGVAERDGLRVRFLPVPGFNDAPEHEHHGIAPLVVHFRGPRKAWMGRWAQRFAA